MSNLRFTHETTSDSLLCKTSVPLTPISHVRKPVQLSTRRPMVYLRSLNCSIPSTYVSVLRRATTSAQLLLSTDIPVQRLDGRAPFARSASTVALPDCTSVAVFSNLSFSFDRTVPSHLLVHRQLFDCHPSSSTSWFHQSIIHLNVIFTEPTFPFARA